MKKWLDKLKTAVKAVAAFFGTAISAAAVQYQNGESLSAIGKSLAAGAVVAVVVWALRNKPSVKGSGS